MGRGWVAGREGLCERDEAVVISADSNEHGQQGFSLWQCYSPAMSPIQFQSRIDIGSVLSLHIFFPLLHIFPTPVPCRNVVRLEHGFFRSYMRRKSCKSARRHQKLDIYISSFTILASFGHGLHGFASPNASEPTGINTA